MPLATVRLVCTAKINLLQNRCMPVFKQSVAHFKSVAMSKYSSYYFPFFIRSTPEYTSVRLLHWRREYMMYVLM